MIRPVSRAADNYRIRLLGGEWATAMSCANAGCAAYRHGWLCVLDVSSDTGAGQAAWIKQGSGRRFYEWPASSALEDALRVEAATGDISVTTELRALLTGLAPGLVVFAFPPRQQCFREHLDREVKLYHGRYEHVKAQDWIEDYNQQADAVNTARERG